MAYKISFVKDKSEKANPKPITFVNTFFFQFINPKGIILSGGPNSVYEQGAPKCDVKIFDLGIPILGICYGMQLMVKAHGGSVISATKKAEYGRAPINIDLESELLSDVVDKSTSYPLI